MCTPSQPPRRVAPVHQSLQEGTGQWPSEVLVLAARIGRTEPNRGAGSIGGSTPAEGRAESVPEAGGTGAEAMATPTTPPAGHDAGLTRETGGLDRR